MLSLEENLLFNNIEDFLINKLSYGHVPIEEKIEEFLILADLAEDNNEIDLSKGLRWCYSNSRRPYKFTEGKYIWLSYFDIAPQLQHYNAYWEKAKDRKLYDSFLEAIEDIGRNE